MRLTANIAIIVLVSTFIFGAMSSLVVKWYLYVMWYALTGFIYSLGG